LNLRFDENSLIFKGQTTSPLPQPFLTGGVTLAPCHREPLVFFQQRGDLLLRWGLLLRASALIAMTFISLLVKAMVEKPIHLDRSTELKIIVANPQGCDGGKYASES
jgi:hypothetical protein